MKTLITAALLAALPASVLAQAPEESATSETERERADISATLDAVYAVISGPIGEARDWDAMRALFVPGATMSAVQQGELWSGNVEDYIERSGSFLVERGFTESALVNRIEIFGDIAQAWSSYSGTWTNEDGSEGGVRGINSFQLMRQDDGNWLVKSIFWQAEGPGNPLPADMEASQ